tara:strand:- start:512 stop:751 length:240 start_codon:yes stop_codon:yes gene_type:complete
MELSWYIVWNIFVTLVFAPIIYQIRRNEAELKRQDILLNKTREEIAKEYVTKSSFNLEFERVLDKLDKLDAKIDKLITN